LTVRLLEAIEVLLDLGDEILARAREQAGRTRPVPASDAELESLRVEALEQLALLPEPPSYRRANDPAREKAQSRLPTAEALYGRALLFHRSAENTRYAPQARAIVEGLEAQLRALAAIAQGQIVRGEEAVEVALARARGVNELQAAFHRVSQESKPVFDRATGASRFDPREAEHLQVTLPCPNPGCRRPALYALGTRTPTHKFTCINCRQPFLGYFGEVRSIEHRQQGRAVHYAMRIDEIGGREQTVQFDDTSGGHLPVAPRDLVALLYTGTHVLAAVENLSSSRVLWVQPKDACFLATAAYGAGAPELATFRRFRDRVLLKHGWGRLAVRGYYRVGPRLARPFERSTTARRWLRESLETLRHHLERRGV
jgi:hypothetical protein